VRRRPQRKHVHAQSGGDRLHGPRRRSRSSPTR
jgi:hypothetical protein